MIEKHVRDYLRNFAAIRNRVDEGSAHPGVYAGTVPRGHLGECIVTSDVTADHFYALSGEVSPRSTILQITCYGNNAARAYSLAEIVRDKLSGFYGLMGDSDETRVLSTTIVSTGGADEEEPADASDKFIHSYTRDFEIIHTTTVPSLA